MTIENTIHFYYIHTLLGLIISSSIILIGSIIGRLLTVFGVIKYKPTEKELNAMVVINVICTLVTVLSAIQLWKEMV